MIKLTKPKPDPAGKPEIAHITLEQIAEQVAAREALTGKPDALGRKLVTSVAEAHRKTSGGLQ
jgi:hypothetical protein